MKRVRPPIPSIPPHLQSSFLTTYTQQDFNGPQLIPKS
jgi:hypothetical protein